MKDDGIRRAILYPLMNFLKYLIISVFGWSGLCCTMRDLSLQHEDSLVVVFRLQSALAR